MIFLDETELVVLTGYRRPKDQIRWLQRNGKPHDINARGRPVVKQDLKTEVRRPKMGSVK